VVGTHEEVKQRWMSKDLFHHFSLLNTKQAYVPMVFTGDKKIGPGFWPELNNRQDIDRELQRIKDIETRLKQEMGMIPVQPGTLSVFSNASLKS
jgi:hypothetical protein